jgi:recombination protein RecA
MDIKDFKSKVARINKDWAKSTKTSDNIPRIRLGSELPEARVISTGNPALDWGLGGGIPEGTIFELYGSPGSGKTVTMSYIMAQVQKSGKMVIYYHTEESWKPSNAWKLAGVDESMLVYIDARRSGEDGINLIRSLLMDENRSPLDIVGMIAIDSVSAMAPEAELNSIGNNGMEGATVGRQAAMMSKLLRIVCGSGWLQKGCIVGLVNQERSQIGTVPLPNITSGGNSIKFYPKIRIQLRAPKDGYSYDESKEIIGHTVDFFVSKNNTGFSTPFRRGSWKVIYGKGLDVTGPVLDEAISYGLIRQPSKARYEVRWLEKDTVRISDPIHGRAQLEAFMESNPEAFEGVRELLSEIRTLLQLKNLSFTEGVAYLDGTETDILKEVFDERIKLCPKVESSFRDTIDNSDEDD